MATLTLLWDHFPRISHAFLSFDSCSQSNSHLQVSGQLDDHTMPYPRDAPIAEQVATSLRGSLEHLGTTYIDSYILHEQMTDSDEMLQVWRAMEAAYVLGLRRHHFCSVSPRPAHPLIRDE